VKVWLCELTLSHSLRDNTFPTWNGTGAGRQDPNWKVSVECPACSHAAGLDDKPFQCDMSFLDTLHVEAYGWY
jgi:hypothetical protein